MLERAPSRWDLGLQGCREQDKVADPEGEAEFWLHICLETQLHKKIARRSMVHQAYSQKFTRRAGR